MSFPRITSVKDSSVAGLSGLRVGDMILSISGVVPRDVIEYQLLVDEASLDLEIERGGVSFRVEVEKLSGQPLGVEVSSALFDRVRTCDNHCEFCFIYQLPKGMRKSLYLKDDDYRLSFLYGNFTTLTRFTEADLERVITEALSPLFVSIHTTNLELRAKMLRNPRGALSLRWLRALLDAGIEVHGQIVVCPGMNDGDELYRTLLDIALDYGDLKSVAAVPLGISRYSNEANMRGHTQEEANSVLDIVEHFQELFLTQKGSRMVWASDEYYLLAERPFPGADTYEGFEQHENGIGMASAFKESFFGDESLSFAPKAGFFSWVDGAPQEGYRAVRFLGRKSSEVGGSEVVLITSEYGDRVLSPILASLDRDEVSTLVVKNEFFGGNIKVAGLMTGADIAVALTGQPKGRRYLLPDVCLSEGRFLDGLVLSDLPLPVEVVGSDGGSLRKALGVTKQVSLV